MICVSIGECDTTECLRMIKGLNFAEIRMDRMNVSLEDVKEIFSAHKNLIATYKGFDGNDKRRKEFLIRAIESGARYVDIEIESPEEFRQEIINVAGRHKCHIILSFHDFKETKDEGTLKAIVERCFEAGADIAKVACMVNNDGDNITLLKLLSMGRFKGKVIVVGMGEKGKITRILAPLLGSPFTFASYREGMEMADGQIEKNVLQSMLSLFKRDTK